MWGNTVAIHDVLKKKTMKLNSQPAQYEKNKIDKDNSGEKNHKKTMWSNTVAIHSVFKEKNKQKQFCKKKKTQKKKKKRQFWKKKKKKLEKKHAGKV